MADGVFNRNPNINRAPPWLSRPKTRWTPCGAQTIFRIWF